MLFRDGFVLRFESTLVGLLDEAVALLFCLLLLAFLFLLYRFYSLFLGSKAEF